MSAPVPSVLFDNHGRPLEYLRLAVTDRCNLRCFYCMPEEGIQYLPKQQLLTYEEMERLVAVMAGLGVRKVRLTGGEPFVRRDLVPFMSRLTEIPGIEELTLTTNGVLTAPHVPELARMGVKAVNLSLDTLDRARFASITRRDELPRVLDTFYALLAAGIRVKINAVVMDGQNTQDLLPLAELTRDLPVDVRFIEEMPFNGGSHAATLPWNHNRIREHLALNLGELTPVATRPGDTASHYTVAGHQGRLGIIAAYSRTFCGTCNRIRLTAEGGLKTCLYDQGVLDIRALLRGGASDADLVAALTSAFRNRAANGFEAEQQRPLHQLSFESMSTIGG
ncbi:cyclic pyranopterin phosphate synthase [Hymenobacter luteus]|uniref:GTP 3',8-cyclase n=2 Tax=Hymenobacter TaxID=89966 RepID=A0A7W9SZD1_9BACT|nr:MULTISPECIES: GTP 3',8-cyclase MoaA [Hymenobacter]MBB4599550.1 cyclic pyranopterin phosphate synthase [Hymenobacter latericoloratus]MBB6058140.1 cyclic pyranopterin phosphate synthase [Hymenobacter luteus]